MPDIKAIRAKINEIDRRLVATLNERAALALELVKLKDSAGLPIYAPDREASVLRGVAGLTKGPLPPTAITAIYREIISSTRALQRVIVVTYLGPAGTYTHQAAREHFGSGAEYNPAETIADVFNDVAKAKADVGVVPIENSTGGVVNETLDMFMSCDLKICDEIVLEIHHYLLGTGKLADVKRVCSKPEAVAQCRVWLTEHLPGVEVVPVASTTAAAKMAAADPSIAAIASREAAELYALGVLAENVEDRHENVTRFVVLSQHCGTRTGRDRTSVMLAIRNEVGALYNILLPFKKHEVNLTKIESRPSKTKVWDYMFFVDMEGHVEDDAIAAALKEIESSCRYVQVLGSYPRADH